MISSIRAVKFFAYMAAMLILAVIAAAGREADAEKLFGVPEKKWIRAAME